MFPAVLAVTQSAASASVIASESVAIPLAFELLAVVVAAATGALTARENKLDLVGAIGLAVLVSLGGGLIRDVILQEGNVYILRQPLALPVAIATAAAVFTFPVMGADKTMLYGYPAITCVMMGFFTAVGGGLLRDVCLARVPYIFQRSNLYAIAAIAGALTYIVLVQCLDIWNIAAAVISVAVTMAVRWWSIRYNIMSPTEVDLHKLPEPVKKVARPVVRPVRKAAQHVSAKTSQAAEQARLRKSERQHKRDRQRETHRHRR